MNSREELLARMIVGSIEESELPALREEIARDPAFAAEIEELTRIDRLLRFQAYLDNEKPDLVVGVLKRLEFEEQNSKAFYNPLSRKIKQQAPVRFGKIIRLIVTPLAIAASLALVVGGWWLAQSRQPAGLGLRVAEVAGEANIQHSTSNIQHPSGEGKTVKALAGMELRQGDQVVVAQGGKIGLKYDREETTIALEEVTTAGFGTEQGGKRVKLEAGRLVCAAAPQRHPFRIETRHAAATVVGTRFAMEVTASKSELSVSEGQVAFERGGQVIPVGAGQAAEATDRGVTLVASSAGPTNGEGRVIRELNIFPVAGAVSYGAGVAYDGKVLWVQTRYTNTLFKVEPKTLAPLGMQDVDVPGKKAWYGLAWDGESLWTIGTEGSKGKIHAVNPATGQLVKTLDGPGGVGLCGVAVGEGCLWLLGCGLGADQKVAWQVLKMDPSNGAVLGSWPVPAEIECWRNGLEYDHGALWIPGRITTNARGEQENELWKLNAADGSVLGRFTVRTTAVDMIEDLAMGDKDGEVWMIGQFRAYLVEFGSQSK